MRRADISNTPMGADQPHQCIQCAIAQMNKASGISFRREDASPYTSLLEMLIQQYHHSLSVYAFRLLGNHDAAQDIVQETWLALYFELQQQPPSWPEVANIPAWLWRVTKNKAINYSKVQRRFSSLDSEHTLFVFEPHIPPFDYPENAAIREDVCRVLYQAVHTLRKPLREVIAYRFFYDFSLDQIAETLGVPLNTVKARLASGKKQLQKVLIARGIERSDLGFWGLEHYPKIVLQE